MVRLERRWGGGGVFLLIRAKVQDRLDFAHSESIMPVISGIWFKQDVFIRSMLSLVSKHLRPYLAWYLTLTPSHTCACKYLAGCSMSSPHVLPQMYVCLVKGASLVTSQICCYKQMLKVPLPSIVLLYIL